MRGVHVAEPGEGITQHTVSLEAERPPIRAFLQARMSSRRFPGKVLAPFRGQPLIDHVLHAVTEALPTIPVVVATSTAPSDDPLVAYLYRRQVPVFRGPLEDVFTRFRLCVLHYPCTWILRLSCDSPLLDARILRRVVSQAHQTPCDLVTTIFPRTFPRGHNAELIRVATFLSLDETLLTATDREHVTGFYYRRPERFHIVNISSGDPALARMSLAIDTVADLHRLEATVPTAFPLFPYEVLQCMHVSVAQ